MKIMIAAGGTGGHIYPGLAIAEEIKRRKPESEIIFVGSFVGMEKDIIPKYGFPLEFVRARGFERGFSWETIEALKGIIDGILDSKKLLKKIKPDIVIGTGGFTSAAIVREAAMKKIPTLIHEQNAYPGRANRLLSRRVNRIAISFEEALQFLPKDKCVFTGNPVRSEFKSLQKDECRKKLGIRDSEFFVLGVGGSQGAGSINKAMVEYETKHMNNEVVICHLTGQAQYKEIVGEIDLAQVKWYENFDESFDESGSRIIVQAYSDKMATLLGAADLVLSRSGAMSIAEFAAVGVPSILVPFPNAAGDHQRINAQAIANLGGGVLIEDGLLSGIVLKAEIEKFHNNIELAKKMALSAKAYGTIYADQKIVDEVCGLLE